MDENDSFLVYVNGINGTRGGYLVPPMTAEQALGLADADEKGRGDHAIELRNRNQRDNSGTYALPHGRDPCKLEEAGWGVIFPFVDAPAARKRQAAIREAIKPLLELRKNQARAGGNENYYREYLYPPGKSKQDFLAANGVGVGSPVYPENMPYYLLIVAEPEEVSFRFQYELDVEYAVGRIAFDTVDEYARYARSVVETDGKKIVLPRRAIFVGTRNEDDRATAMSSEKLVPPLRDALAKELQGWSLESLMKEQVTKDALAGVFNAPAPPSLLFTASHGMGFEKGDHRQFRHQGALLCSDCPDFRQKIDEKYYVSADDVGTHASLFGTIAFFFACYGAGTPQLNDFPHEEGLKVKNQLAARSFVAPLPLKMLSNPRGGALAVVGHVERAWANSFMLHAQQPQIQSFRSALNMILSGYPVGAAMEVFNERYAALATVLTGELDKISLGLQLTPVELARTSSMWTAHNDARSYVVIGDPAVRLFPGDVPSDPRPVFSLPKISANVGSKPNAARPDGGGTAVPGIGTAANEGAPKTAPIPPGDLPFPSSLIESAEKRFQELNAGRTESFDIGAASVGGLLGTNPPDALARRLRRIGLAPEVADAAVKRSLATSFAVGTRGPSSAFVGLERIIGRNMLLGVQYLDAGRLAARTVARILIRGASGQTIGFGTGWLVAPGLLITNNHVLGSVEQARRSLAQFDFQSGPDGRPLATATFAIDADAFFVTSSLDALDFTLVAVKSTSDDGRRLLEFGHNRLGALAGEIVAGESVTIIQHPNGEPKQIALRENLVIKLPQAEDRFLHYQTDTTPGSSGSPVFNDQWEAVALHHSGAPRRNNRGEILARNGAVWTQSMGEQAIDWIANEGIRIAAIISHLRGLTGLGAQGRALLQPVLEAAAAEAAGPAPVRSNPDNDTGRSDAAVPLAASVPGTVAPPTGGASATWVIPIEITLRLGAPTPDAPAGEARTEVAVSPSVSPPHRRVPNDASPSA
jgi:V8-like Glu-specific endopeptidase